MTVLTETTGLTQDKVFNTGDELDFEVRHGTTLHAEFAYTDELGAPIDLSGHAIVAYYALSKETATPLSFTIDDSDFANGNFSIEISATANRAMQTDETYYWDMKLLEPDGFERELLYGTIVVKQQVKLNG